MRQSNTAMGPLSMLSVTQLANRSAPVVCTSSAFCRSKSNIRAGARGIFSPRAPSKCLKTIAACSCVLPSVSLAVSRRAAKIAVGTGTAAFLSIATVFARRLSLSAGCSSLEVGDTGDALTGSKWECTVGPSASNSSRSPASNVRFRLGPGARRSQSACSSRNCGRSRAASRLCRLSRLPDSPCVWATASAMSVPKRWMRRSAK
mmetsp:Transcript_45606/g.105334  ORF Transcript_45606/g.105334 Transcript_45606/m.105334 type:complete len:204 (-) Transcript_45606:514-1125(-)